MNSAVLRYNKIFNYLENLNSENIGLSFSFFIHFLILLTAIGLPNFFDPKPIMIPTIIPIEIINITDTTSIPKEIKDSNSVKMKQSKIKEKKFNSSDNQEIKKIEIKDKPLIKDKIIEKNLILKKDIVVKEKKELPLEINKKKIKLEINNTESLPSKKIKPKLKPKPTLSESNQVKKSDVIVNTKPKLKPEPKFNIASMLKDLRNEKTSKKIELEKNDKNDNILEKIEENIDSEIAELSISEIDLVLQQLSRCFIAPAGAEIKKTMFVKISAKIQRNRRVYENSIRIVDTNISKSNSVYGPITESAMRTLLNPECIPLKLPEEKYDTWKNLTMKFDYSVMRGN